MEQFLEWNMEILRVIASWRTAIGDEFFALITHLGEETVFFAVLLFVYWCLDKRRSYYLFAVCMSGNILFNVMKIAFHIARPWVLDPSFQIVEAAREQAAGYSFPSGHSLSVVAICTTLGVTTKKKWLKIVLAVIGVLIPFSRMYLGVHTPFDVVVGVAMALALVLIYYPFFRDEEASKKNTKWALVCVGVLALATFLYVVIAQDTFPHSTDEELANLATALKNVYMFLACVIAFAISYVVDLKVLHFETKAPFWGQLLKYVLGVAIVLGIKAVLKQPMIALCGGNEPLASGIRYFIVCIIISILWPLTFPLWQKIGAKKKEA